MSRLTYYSPNLTVFWESRRHHRIAVKAPRRAPTRFYDLGRQMRRMTSIEALRRDQGAFQRIVPQVHQSQRHPSDEVTRQRPPASGRAAQPSIAIRSNRSLRSALANAACVTVALDATRSQVSWFKSWCRRFSPEQRILRYLDRAESSPW